MSRKAPHEVDHKPYSRHTQMHPLPGQSEQHTDPRHETFRKATQTQSQRYQGHQQPYQTQAQQQDQLQRPVEATFKKSNLSSPSIFNPMLLQELTPFFEASKQMLYGTFGNVIAILEEYEKREIAEKGAHRSHIIRRSNIPIHDQTRKTNDDLKSNVETQLLLFETQCKACPPEVKAALLEELKQRTLGWAAVRSEAGLPGKQNTDRYIAKLYEILSKGRTDHKVPSTQGLNEGVMRESFQAMLYGDHDREILDQSFKRNPNKKANAPDTRHSEMYDEGARRISEASGTRALNPYLQQDVRRFQEYGPKDLK